MLGVGIARPRGMVHPLKPGFQKKKRALCFLRNVLTWVVALVVLPVGILVGMEGALRLLSVGEDTRPIVRREVAGIPFHQLNGAFFRTFVDMEVPSAVSGVSLRDPLDEKRPEELRVFVFGGSAAKGWPDQRYAFWRFLEVKLEARFPGTDVEMYCFAAESMDSHVMRAVAKACEDLSPDVFLVLMGNNELNGPFSEVYLGEGYSSSTRLRFIQAGLALSSLRLYQVMVGMVHDEPGHSGLFPQEPCPVMEQATTDVIMRNFEANLQDICRFGKRADAEVVLCTVPVNLRDWPPSVSGPRYPLDETLLGEWEARVARAESLQEAGRFEEALAAFDEAGDIADGARLRFYKGWCLWELGRFVEARQCFERALEWDGAQFARARARTNRVIQEVATSQASTNVTIVDVAKELGERSPHGITGREYFSDQCHFSVEGGDALADVLLPPMTAILEERTGRSPTSKESLSLEEAMARLAIHPYGAAVNRNRLADHFAALGVSDLSGLRAYCNAAHAGVADPDWPTQRAMYERALSHEPFDFYVGFHYLRDMLVTAETLPRAREVGERLVVKYPQSADVRAYYGETLSRMGDVVGAEAQFAIGIEVDPHASVIHLKRGQAALRAGQYEAAMQCCRRALVGHPDDILAHCCEAEALAGLNRPEALQALVEVIRFDPDRGVGIQELERYLSGHGMEMRLESELSALFYEFPHSSPLREALRRIRDGAKP